MYVYQGFEKRSCKKALKLQFTSLFPVAKFHFISFRSLLKEPV